MQIFHIGKKKKNRQKSNEKNRNELFVNINLINFIISKPSKIHQTGDEDQAMQKALSMSLESHRQEEDRKKQNNTLFDEKGQSTDTRQPCPLVSPPETVSGNVYEV